LQADVARCSRRWRMSARWCCPADDPALAARGCRRLRPESRPTWRELLTMSAYGSAVAASIAASSTLWRSWGGDVFLALVARFSDLTGLGLVDALRRPNLDSYLSKGESTGDVAHLIAVLGPFNEEFGRASACACCAARTDPFIRPPLRRCCGCRLRRIEANEYGLGRSRRARFAGGTAAASRWRQLAARAGSGNRGIGWYYLSQAGVVGAWRCTAGVGLQARGRDQRAGCRTRLSPVQRSFRPAAARARDCGGVLALGVLLMLWKLSGSLARRAGRRAAGAAARYEPPAHRPLAAVIARFARPLASEEAESSSAGTITLARQARSALDGCRAMSSPSAWRRAGRVSDAKPRLAQVQRPAAFDVAAA